jgi:hypothetical protein
MSWENWIKQQTLNEANLKNNNYDEICEYIARTYGLNDRTRKQSHIDNIQCFLKWWKKNLRKMRKYDTMGKVSLLIDRDRCVISHYLVHRKRSAEYQENTKELRDFLNA